MLPNVESSVTPNFPSNSGGAVQPDLASLISVLRLILVSTLISTGSLCALLLRQDLLLLHQIQAQTPAVEESISSEQRITTVVTELQKLGQRFPDYSRAVLSSFNLPPLMGVTNSALPTGGKPPVGR